MNPQKIVTAMQMRKKKFKSKKTLSMSRMRNNFFLFFRNFFNSNLMYSLQFLN